MSKLIVAEAVGFDRTRNRWTVNLTTSDFLPPGLVCELELAVNKHPLLQLETVVKLLPVDLANIGGLRQYLKTFLTQLYPGGHGLCVDWNQISWVKSSQQHGWQVTIITRITANQRLLQQYRSRLQTHLMRYGWPKLSFSVKYVTSDQTPTSTAVRLKQVSDVKKTTTNNYEKSQPHIAPLGRVELHVHTKMTAMDGVGAVEDYFTRARELKCAAVAFTDRDNVQAFPVIERVSAKYPEVKPIYGIQFNVFDDVVRICLNDHPPHTKIDHAKYAFLDLETTGLSPRFDEIIEVGLVLVDNLTALGLNQVEKVTIQIKPEGDISPQAQALSGIKMSDLVAAPSAAQVMPQIIKHLQGRVVVAHNAEFDWNFIQASCDRLGLDRLTNTVIDTLTLARVVLTKVYRFKLEVVARSLKVRYDKQQAHRGLYDAWITYQVFPKLLALLRRKHDISYLDQMNDIKSSVLFSRQQPFWATVLSKNQAGLKTLFELVSHSHTKSFFGRPQISRRMLMAHRANLLIGSSGWNNEILTTFYAKSDDAVANLVHFYDYIEVPPPNTLQLLRTKFNFSEQKIAQILTGIITIARRHHKLVVVSSDAHYARPSDWIVRDIYVKTEGLKGRRHYLFDFRQPQLASPPQHLRSITELQDDFNFLDAKIAKEIIVTNPRRLAEQISPIKIIKNKLFPPTIKSTLNEIENLCWTTVRNKYGNPPPELINQRLNRELKIIFQHQFTVVFWIAQRVAQSSLRAGYLVGSRGSVGSSLVAMLLGITEVNPLPAHYLCVKTTCRFSDFTMATKFKSGFDLPSRVCPRCQAPLHGDGHDIPFSTFLGLKGEKIPDIDLNFAGEYQEQAHEQVRNVFGRNHTFRTGTISTVANRTAFIYVNNYFNRYGRRPVHQGEFETIVNKCTGIKRTTGQHPGGIVIIPDRYTVEDFTPVNYPANDIRAHWLTTHFDFDALHDNLLKIDILGHDDPRVLRMLFELTSQDPLKISFANAEVMSLFRSSKALNIIDDSYRSGVGSLGIPEFGTGFVRRMLSEIKPQKFSDLVAISGLSHGKKVWVGNFRELFLTNQLKFDDIFACRDDIFTQLRHRGVDEQLAFRIMERVRSGRGITSQDQQLLLQLKVDRWFITACSKISYLFPKAHAVAYVMMAWRVAWYKINFPVEYYATFFSIRTDNFDLAVILNGPRAIAEARAMLKTKTNHATSTSLLDKKKQVLYDVALEMYARGVKLKNVDLNHSAATHFRVVTTGDQKYILPPLSAIPSLGITVADSIIKARTEKPITSVVDLQARTKVNKTHVMTFKKLKILTAKHEHQVQMGLF